MAGKPTGLMLLGIDILTALRPLGFRAVMVGKGNPQSVLGEGFDEWATAEDDRMPHGRVKLVYVLTRLPARRSPATLKGLGWPKRRSWNTPKP